MYAFVLSQNNNVNSTIDSLIELYGKKPLKSYTFSDQCLLVSKLLESRKDYDWLDAFCENHIRKLIENVLRMNNQENRNTLVEEIQKSLITLFYNEIEELIQERYDSSLPKEDSSWED